MTCGGFEPPHGRQRREMTHVWMISSAYQLCHAFSWRGSGISTIWDVSAAQNRFT